MARDRFLYDATEVVPDTEVTVLLSVNISNIHSVDATNIKAELGQGHNDPAEPEETGIISDALTFQFTGVELTEFLANVGTEWTAVKREILRIASIGAGKVGVLDPDP